MGLFDKFLDKFGSLEATRNSLRKNYYKYRGNAVKKGNNAYGAHFDAVIRLLRGRTMSPLCEYNLNMDIIVYEIYPFVLEEPKEKIPVLEETLPILIEYILYLEEGIGKSYNTITDSLDGSDIEYGFLRDGILNIIKNILDSEKEIEKEDYDKHVHFFNKALELNLGWTRFINMAYRLKIKEHIDK